VKVVAFYISEQTPGTRPGQEIEVVDKRLVGTDMLQVTFDPGTYTFDGSPMHHADILVQTTGERCQSGFGFGTLTRPR